MVSKETLAAIAADLRAGRAVELSPADFPCFSAEALKGNMHVSPDDLGKLSAALTAADAPTFERAARAMAEGDTLETLEAHIHQVEHELYPRVLGWLAAGRVSVDAEGKVHLAE